MLDPVMSAAAEPNDDGVGATPMDTSVSRPRPGVVMITVRGEIDTLTAPPFEVALEELLADAEARRLVVDLTGVTFLASSGLAVLIRAARRTSGRAVRLRLVAGTRAVRRPLEVTGIDQLFDLHDDPAAAVGDAD